MSIPKIFTLCVLTLCGASLTLILRDASYIWLLVNIPLCAVVIFACTNKMMAMTISIAVGGIFLDALLNAYIPIFTLIFVISGISLRLLMSSRLAQHTILAAMISAAVATILFFLLLTLYSGIMLHDWPRMLFMHLFTDYVQSALFAFIIHISISVTGVTILSYAPTTYRFRPYTT